MPQVEYVISLKDKNFGSGIDQANNKVNGLEGSIKKFAGMAAGAFAIGAVVGFAKEVTQLGAQFDSYEASLATLLKSEEKAHAVFQQIKQDAKATPFDTESLVMANRALIGAGESAEGARDVTMNLANAIAAVGGSSENLKSMAVNLNQIKSIGKATALDIKQFVFAGLPIYEMLSKATGKSVEEVKEMDVSYDLLATTLKKSAAAGGMFEGALDKMANSTAGQISNLDEAITFLKVDLYNGLKPVIQEVLVHLANFVQKFVDGINWANEHKDGLVKVFAPVKKLIDPIVNAIGSLVDRFKQANGEGSMLENTFNTIGSVLLFLEPVFESVGDLIGGIIEAVGIMGSAINSFVERFNKPISGLLTAFRNVFSGIAQSAKHFLTGVANLIGGILSGDTEQIKKGLGGLGEAFKKGNVVTLGYEAAKGFGEGYEKGLKTTDFFDDKAKESGLAGIVANEKLGPAGGSFASSGIQGSSAGKVSSVKPTSITINIDSLIKDFKIVTENLGMDKNKIAAEVSKLLMGVVNDTNRLAGI